MIKSSETIRFVVIWARFRFIYGQRGKMDFTFTGLGSRIWGAAGGRLGSPKCPKNKKTIGIISIGAILVGSTGVAFGQALGRP